jgi:signal peptidase I
VVCAPYETIIHTHKERLKLKSDTATETDIVVEHKKSVFRENVEAIVIAVILALFIRTFVVQAFKIPSGSMKNTLLIGDHILVNKFIYGIKFPFIKYPMIPVSTPERNDIVVFQFPEDPEKDFIKRVVGLPGDIVECRDKVLFVNGQKVDTSFAVFNDQHVLPGSYQPRDNFGPVKIPDKSLFVMGDNRDESYDSRFWGVFDMAALKGKAFMIYWSWDRNDFGVRWRRIGRLLK